MLYGCSQVKKTHSQIFSVSARYRKPGERKKREMQIYLHVESIFFHMLKGVYCVLGLHESKREQNFQQKTGRLNGVQQSCSGLSCQPLPVMKQEMMEPFRKAQILNGVYWDTLISKGHQSNREFRMYKTCQLTFFSVFK